MGPLHLLRVGDTYVQRLGLHLVKKAELLPAVMLFSVTTDDMLSDLALTSLDVAAALEQVAKEPVLVPVAAAALPLEAYDTSNLQVFRDPDGRTEHYAIEIGTPDRSKPVLSRLHSACFTGDVLGSLKCDCGPQLQAALARMGQEGSGVLLYLNQEGRGIGLANKMRGYDLQSQGFDTVEANHRLDADRLLTKNPAKVETFRSHGITITEQLPLRVARNVHNDNYLTVKALKSGHLL